MLSARGKPDASGYARADRAGRPARRAAYDEIIKSLRANEIVTGKFLSPDGELALAVVALDRKVVEDRRQGRDRQPAQDGGGGGGAPSASRCS